MLLQNFPSFPNFLVGSQNWITDEEQVGNIPIVLFFKKKKMFLELFDNEVLRELWPRKICRCPKDAIMPEYFADSSLISMSCSEPLEEGNMVLINPKNHQLSWNPLWGSYIKLRFKIFIDSTLNLQDIREHTSQLAASVKRDICVPPKRFLSEMWCFSESHDDGFKMYELVIYLEQENFDYDFTGAIRFDIVLEESRYRTVKLRVKVLKALRKGPSFWEMLFLGFKILHRKKMSNEEFIWYLGVVKLYELERVSNEAMEQLFDLLSIDFIKGKNIVEKEMKLLENETIEGIIVTEPFFIILFLMFNSNQQICEVDQKIREEFVKVFGPFFSFHNVKSIELSGGCQLLQGMEDKMVSLNVVRGVSSGLMTKFSWLATMYKQYFEPLELFQLGRKLIKLMYQVVDCYALPQSNIVARSDNNDTSSIIN